ncbi:MAG: VWA domain-containing protein [Planctomycetota bacterium]|jgi:hypothetical protein
MPPPAALRVLPDWTPAEAREAARLVGSYLDIAGTAMGRATHYNSRAEQAAAEDAVHAAVFALSRDLYGALGKLPGVTDHTRIRVALRLLTAPAADDMDVVNAVAAKLTPPRLLRLVAELRRARANSGRVRRFIVRALLGSPKLELWSVKYRRKLRAALTHAWGVRLASILASILEKRERTPRERAILRREIERYAVVPAAAARECVAFVFGYERDLQLDMTRRFRDAKSDLAAGRGLPPEVLEGIRGSHHKATSPNRVLTLARGAMTSVQRMRVQRRAEKAGVEIAFDPRRIDAVRLYVYAYERGMDDKIESALADKARTVAEAFPVRIEHVGILLDASASMAGAREQAMRPIAAALAMRDVLFAAAVRSSLVVSGGAADGALVRPQGATSLARGLVELLRLDPDAVFVLTDGYENAPAGRFGETLDAIRELGIDTPVYQMSPVFGAEAGGLRDLAPKNALALPVAGPQSLGLAYVRGLLESNPMEGIRALLRG